MWPGTHLLVWASFMVFLPIHFVGLVNACGIYHQSNSMCSSLVGNNYCWLGSTAWEDGLTGLNFAEFRTA
jgi:hypothetical protein